MAWILSTVDVGPGGRFQARSILNAFAKTRGAPWLSESGWDTAHSISCWPMSTRVGQSGLQPASTWLSLQTPARSMEAECGQQDLPGRSANGNKQCKRGAVLMITADSQVHCCVMDFLQQSTRLCCSVLRLQKIKDWEHHTLL